MSAAVAAIVHGGADFSEADRIMTAERGKEVALLP
jgi:hypothetical protein